MSFHTRWGGKTLTAITKKREVPKRLFVQNLWLSTNQAKKKIIILLYRVYSCKAGRQSYNPALIIEQILTFFYVKRGIGKLHFVVIKNVQFYGECWYEEE
jgi:hypothetical protein